MLSDTRHRWSGWTSCAHTKAPKPCYGTLSASDLSAVEDCSQPLRMPKMDVLPEGGAFMAAFAVRLDEEDEPRLRAEAVDLVVGPGYLVTVRDGPLGEVEERFRSQILAAQTWLESPGFSLAHAALDALVDRHAPVMVRTAATAEDLEESLDPWDERSSIAALEALITVRRGLLAFRRLAVAQQEILRRLGHTVPDLREYLSDVADNQCEAVDMADATRDYVEGATEAYQIRRDERSEVGIRRLTVLAGILGPLSLLTAIYATNFPDIPGTGKPWGLGLRRDTGALRSPLRVVSQ